MAHCDTLPDVIRSAASGDNAALAELFRRYGTIVFQAAYRLTGSLDDADDVVQDVFVGLPEALRRYSEQARFDAWLKRITIRVTLARMRLDRRHLGALAGEFTAFAERDSGENSAALNARMAIEQALAQLSESARLVFTLKAAEGYSHAEIAALLGISRAASEVRYWRAVRQLRRILEAVQ